MLASTDREWALRLFFSVDLIDSTQYKAKRYSKRELQWTLPSEEGGAAEYLLDMANGQGIRTFAECAGANPFTYPVMEGASGISGKTCQIGHRRG